MPEQTESQTVLTYWLLPAQPAREFFRETIGRLAAECDAPLFAPHLTLAVGPDSVAQAQRILAGVAAGPIELHANGDPFHEQIHEDALRPIRLESARSNNYESR